jgi:hypothetical protein
MSAGGSASAVAAHFGPLAHTLAIPLAQLRVQTWLQGGNDAPCPGYDRHFDGAPDDLPEWQVVRAAIPEELRPTVAPSRLVIESNFSANDGLAWDIALRAALVRATIRYATGRQAYWKIPDHVLRDSVLRADTDHGGWPRPHIADAALRGFVVFCSDVHHPWLHSYRAPNWNAAVLRIEVPWSDTQWKSALNMQVPYRKVIREAGRLIELQSGFATGDASAIRRAGMDWLKDAELGRFIPGFFPAREAAWESGALNVGLVGQQPSMLIIAAHPDALQQAVAAATEAFSAHTTRVHTHFSALRAPRPDSGPTGDSDG